MMAREDYKIKKKKSRKPEEFAGEAEYHLGANWRGMQKLEEET